jgi:hypothetical protein
MICPKFVTFGMGSKNFFYLGVISKLDFSNNDGTEPRSAQIQVKFKRNSFRGIRNLQRKHWFNLNDPSMTQEEHYGKNLAKSRGIFLQNSQNNLAQKEEYLDLFLFFYATRKFFFYFTPLPPKEKKTTQKKEFVFNFLTYFRRSKKNFPLPEMCKNFEKNSFFWVDFSVWGRGVKKNFHSAIFFLTLI